VPRICAPRHSISFILLNTFMHYIHLYICAHTRYKTKLHIPTAHLTQFQKGVYYSAVKIFSNLLHHVQELAAEPVVFQNALKSFLLRNFFYNADAYFNYKEYFT
jgi:hypothetical protein